MLSLLFSLRRAARSFIRGTLRYIFGRRGQRRVHGWRLVYHLSIQSVLRTRRTLPRAEVRLWVDRAVFPRVLKLLRRARHTIVIHMFMWKHDRIGTAVAAALVGAAERGVKVAVIKEAAGDMFELSQDFLSTRHKNDDVWGRFWTHPNIHVSYDLHDDHTKAYVIDDHTLLLSGMNIADEYDRDWHDYMIELRGSHFVREFLTGGDLPAPRGTGRRSAVKLVMNTRNRKDIRPVLHEFLRSAKHSILLEQSYVSDPECIDLLIARSKEGIRITLIIPQAPTVHHAANMQTVGRLLTEGDPRFVQVLLYQHEHHGKVVLVDRNRAFIGSANLITSSLDSMGEANVLIDRGHRRAMGKLRDVIREDILVSRPITTPPVLWWWGRAKAWIGL